MMTVEAIADAALVTAARDGDSAAYGELFTRYQSRIYNYAYGIAGNPEDARDIAQEAFVRVFEALPRLTGDLKFSAYIYRTAHNLAINTVKGRAPLVPPEVLDYQMEPSLRADPERVALVQEQQEQAWRAAFELGENHRAILSLRELHDLSYQDIADIMEMPRNTVGVLLSRARLRFKEAFRMTSVDVDKLTAECRNILPLLSAYLDGELDQNQRVRVEAHLEQCAFCRLALEEMTECSRSYRALLPLLPPAALGEGVWHKLSDRLKSEEAHTGSEEAHAGSEDAQTRSEDAQTGAAHEADAPRSGRPRSGRKRSWYKISALAAGAAAVVLLSALFASGILGWSHGPRASMLGGEIAIASAPTTIPPVSATAAPPTPTSPTTVSTTSSTATSSTSSSAGSTGAMATSATSSSTAATSATSTTATPTDTQRGTTRTSGSESSTTTKPPDTQAPPTPAVIYPSAGDVVKSAKVVLRWGAVKDPSGVTYGVEVQSFNANTRVYLSSRSAQGLTLTQLVHTMVSSRERWRVTAIDGAGNASAPSSWAKFTRLTIPPPLARRTTTLK